MKLNIHGYKNVKIISHLQDIDLHLTNLEILIFIIQLALIAKLMVYLSF